MKALDKIKEKLAGKKDPRSQARYVVAFPPNYMNRKAKRARHGQLLAEMAKRKRTAHFDTCKRILNKMAKETGMSKTYLKYHSAEYQRLANGARALPQTLDKINFPRSDARHDPHFKGKDCAGYRIVPNKRNYVAIRSKA